MVKYNNQQLDAAPVTEAIVDIRIKPLPDEDISALGKLAENVSDKFPVIREMKQQSMKLGLGDDGIFSGEGNTPDIHGYRLETEDGRKVAQLRKNGFTFSLLRPYTSWEEVSEEARELYKLYSEAVSKDTFITRVALRYINHIELPLPCDFSEYFTAPPTIPENLPQELLGFLTQNIINCPESGAVARVVQNLHEIKDGKTASVLLDIDVIKEYEDYLDLYDESIWETFENLRVLKNEIFFESITEKTEGLLK